MLEQNLTLIKFEIEKNEMKFCRENYRIARIAFTTLPIRM